MSCPPRPATTIKPPAVAADILFTFDASMVSAKELSACVPFADIAPAQCTPGAAGDAYCAGAFGPDFVCDATLGRCSECAVSTEESLTLASSHTASTCDLGLGDLTGEMLLFLYSFSSAPIRTPTRRGRKDAHQRSLCARYALPARPERDARHQLRPRCLDLL